MVGLGGEVVSDVLGEAAGAGNGDLEHGGRLRRVEAGGMEHAYLSEEEWRTRGGEVEKDIRCVRSI